jgi:hypothetical protein
MGGERVESGQPAQEMSAAVARAVASDPMSARVALLQAAGNRAVARWLAPPRRLQRVGGWTGANAGNSGEQTLHDVRRVPVEGLAPVSRALVLIPTKLDPSKPIDVLVHLHGQNQGYLAATPRDIDPGVDRIEEQMKAAGRTQMAAVLPQGSTNMADYGEFSKLDPKTYAEDALKKVGALDAAASTSGAMTATPTIGKVVLSGHSGGGFAIKAILDNPALAKSLSGIAWFDAVQAESGKAEKRSSTGQREAAKKLIVDRITDELKTVPSGATADAATAALRSGFQFRLYYDANGLYAGAAKEIETFLQGLFGESGKPPASTTTLAAQIGALDPAARAALRARYQTIGVKRATDAKAHAGNLTAGQLETTGHEGMIGSNALADALGAMPYGKPPAAATTTTPTPVVPPTPTRKTTSLELSDESALALALDVSGGNAVLARSRILAREEDVPARLINEIVALGRDDGAGPTAGKSLLRKDDIRKSMENLTGADKKSFDDSVMIIKAFDKSANEYQWQAYGWISILENKFIHDSSRSTIDLLSPARAKHFRDITWGRLDYPGHAPDEEAGAQEGEAVAMATELAILRPERRPNSGSDAVIVKSEMTDAKRKRLVANLKDVPGQTGHKLFSEATDAFEKMAKIAAYDNITLTIVSSWRDPGVAAANAAASGNAMAVAAFSSHSLGLAIDIAMSGGGQHFQETTTRPMSNVAGMRSSEAHKWMVLRAEKFGWYPYGHEPWHWEYNPPGLRDRYRKALEPAAPPAPVPAGSSS